ncbi:MAG: glycoside hydrolase family 15 protein [Firmicutes bacterium]|nr:glycoside hydrolase family 15 protein [Bacillota bacterium]
MPRPLVVGNGRLLVNFDSQLNLRDLYYPHVGMLNHTCGHRNSIGVWVDGTFSWVDEGGWERELGYESETLVTKTRATNRELRVELLVSDAVHFRRDILLRRVEVRSLAGETREIRIFFNHDLCIDQTDIGDTALYDPSQGCLMHYKRDKCFIISGEAQGAGFFQFATGIKRFAGAEGTWRDAEDGCLEGNPIAQGSVDSVASFRLSVAPGASGVVRYWITVARRFEEARRLHEAVPVQGFDSLLEETRYYWRSWVNKKERDYRGLSPRLIELFKRSLLIVRTQIDRKGGVLAANDTDILQFNRDHYSYVWPRDGAFVCHALDRAGYHELTSRFFTFCVKALTPEGFLWHKYNPDGSVGSSWHPWVRDGRPQLPIQEDETSLVIFGLWNFYRRALDLEFVQEAYEPFIKPAADFLCRYRDPDSKLPLESYDLWEERRGVFAYTAACVCAGLTAAGRFARLFGDRTAAERYLCAAAEVKEGISRYFYRPDLCRFIRGYYRGPSGEVQDLTLESSVFWITGLGILPPNDERVVSTMRAIEKGLWVKTEVGGIARYERDYYFHKSGDFEKVPGNPWLVCTLWLASWYAAKARSRDEIAPALKLLDWAADRALATGVMSEQIHPWTGAPESVAPLTWSHGAFLTAVLDCVSRLRELEERRLMAAAWHSQA